MATLPAPEVTALLSPIDPPPACRGLKELHSAAEDDASYGGTMGLRRLTWRSYDNVDEVTCALAGPGELLASDTIVNLARKMKGLEYGPRTGMLVKNDD